MSPVLAIWESPIQLIVVGVIALLLFGNRLPEVMRSLGKGITEFKKGMHGLDEDSTRAPQEPARSLPLDARTELVAPKYLPPATVPAPPQSTTPA